MITLRYLHDIPVDSISLKLFDGAELVATVSMTAVEDGDRACLWSGELEAVPDSSTLEWEVSENGGTKKVAWGEANGFVDGETVRLDEDRTLKSTVAGRTLNVEADGTIAVTAEVAEESIRDAMGLEEGQRVSTPDDLAVNVVVTPLSVTTPKDIEQSTLYLRLEDSSEYRIEEVKGSDGDLIDLSLIANLELVIESYDEVEVEVITDLELINDNHGVAFSPSVAVQTATYPPKHHLWALRDSDNGNRVLAGGPCVVTRYAKKA